MDFCVYISLLSVVDNTTTYYLTAFSVVSEISVISEVSTWPQNLEHFLLKALHEKSTYLSQKWKMVS